MALLSCRSGGRSRRPCRLREFVVAGERGFERLLIKLVGVEELLDGEAVDVEAKRGDGTGTARVEHADAARVAAHALEEGFGDACGAGELNGGLDLLAMTASGLIT